MTEPTPGCWSGKRDVEEPTDGSAVESTVQFQPDAWGRLVAVVKSQASAPLVGQGMASKSGVAGLESWVAEFEGVGENATGEAQAASKTARRKVRGAAQRNCMEGKLAHLRPGEAGQGKGSQAQEEAGLLGEATLAGFDFGERVEEGLFLSLIHI